MASKDSFVKCAKKHVCNLLLRDLAACQTTIPFVSEEHTVHAEIYRNLVLYTPSRESNLGTKISRRLEKHIDELVRDILQGLDVKHCYVFSAYQSNNAEKIDLGPSILAQSQPYLCLYCNNSFLESLFASVRNALAHGNIIQFGNYYYLYALSKGNGQVAELDRNISFLLKIYNLDKLDAYIKAFKKYN